MATKTSAAPKDAKFTVGLICALPLEAAAVCAMLDKPYDAPARSGNDNNAYDLGKIHEHNVVIASLPAGCMGNDTAAIVANDMVRTYGETLRVCLLIGVAGGIVENEDVRLGDVVVGFPREKSSGVIQYDFGKHEDDEIRLTGHLNKPPPIILSALSKLIRHHLNNEPNFPVYLRNAIQKNNSTRRHFAYPGLNADRLFKAECIHPLKEKTCNNCPEDWEEDRKPRESQDPVVHYGTIASGNAVIKNSSARKRLSEKAEGALCLEMEAAGLSKAFPCLVIRGICDYADSHKNKQWRGYAAMAAAAFAKEFLSHLPAEEVSSQPTVQEIWSSLEDLSEMVNLMSANVATIKQQSNDQLQFAMNVEQRRCHEQFSTEYESYKELNPPAAEGTCKWVLESEEYRRWRHSGRQNVLWLSASPGCGKSVLAKSLVDTHLRAHEYPTTVCYFFFRDKTSNGLATALRALLHQLFTQQPELIVHAMHPKASGLDPKNAEAAALWRVLKGAAADEASRAGIICVLDALDECPGNHEAIMQILEEVQERQPTPDVKRWFKFFVTSRPDTRFHHGLHVLRKSSAGVLLEDKEYQGKIREEIKTVIEANVNQLADEFNLPPERQQDLSERLLEVDNYTHLWPQLITAYLRTQYATSLKPEKVPIISLPASVSAIYCDLLNRITGDARESKAILKIVVAACRPLSTWELGMATDLAVCDTQKTRDDALVHPAVLEGKIREKCGQLVIIRDGFVYLLHQTVREFLVVEDHVEKPPSSFCFTNDEAQTALADVCIKFLMLDRDQTRSEQDDETWRLIDYTAFHWVDHVRSLPRALRMERDETVYKLYAERCAKWIAYFWGQAMHIRPDHRPNYSPEPLLATHTAAFNGHAFALRRLLRDGQESVQQADNEGTTALIWSSRAGKYDASKVLIEAGADLGAQSKHYGTPLLVAALNGHQDIVQLLLDHGAAVNQYCGALGKAHYIQSRRPEHLHLPSHTGTALFAASINGHLPIVKLLLDHEATERDFALMAASYGGHMGVVDCLLENGAEIHAHDERSFYGSPVQAAALAGHEQTIRSLFDRGANDVLEVGKFDSALHAAANNDHGLAIKALIELAAPDHYSNYDFTEALGLACLHSNNLAVATLAPLVSNINAPLTYERKSALHYALECCGFDVIMTILQNGADVQAGNPLLKAASRGCVDAVKFLIENGADVNADDPLTPAVRSGVLEAVQPLVERGADINKGYLLASAARHGYAEILEYLLECDAGIDDIQKGYPLAEAARYGYEDIVETLLAYGADPDEGYALLEAVSAGHPGIVRLLLEDDADVNEGYPLHVAAREDYRGIAKMLIDKGADVHLEQDGKNPLEIAIEWKHGTIMSYIFATGEDVRHDP